jgi:hypothetical protein
MKLRLLIFTIPVFAYLSTANATIPDKSAAERRVSFADKTTNNVTADTSQNFNLYISQNTLNIKCNNPMSLTNGEVVVYNILGKEITRKKLEKANLNLVALPSQVACYIVRITYSNRIYTQKVISPKE